MNILRSITLAATLVGTPAYAGPIIIARPVIVSRPAVVARPVVSPRATTAKATPVARPVYRPTQTEPVHASWSWSWLPFWVSANAATQRASFERACRQVQPARRSAECLRAIGRR